MSDLLYQEGFTQNRELSWLRFNERVLQEAGDSAVPLLERLKYVAIFSSNLDEFFMIRVGSLFDILAMSPASIDRKSGMTPKEQLRAIFQATPALYAQKDALYQEVSQALRVYHIEELTWETLLPAEQKAVKAQFKHNISPLLSPHVLDDHHPFPHLQNNVLHIVARLQRHDGQEHLGIIPLPAFVDNILYLQKGTGLRYIRTVNILLHFLEKIFPQDTILERAVLRVTRNSDLNFDNENYDITGNFKDKMKRLLSQRKRLAPVRLELSETPSLGLEEVLCHYLGLERTQVFVTRSPMLPSFVFDLSKHLNPQRASSLTYAPFSPKVPPSISLQESLLQQIRENDVLLSYPFESMEPFLHLLKEAAHDPAVLSIKITIYRLASKTKLVEFLCAAAENGKEVTVLIELRARFDEQNNIDWSERLEEAGCHVMYGIEQYKVHSKLCLITRREKHEIKYYTQVGTGNYNEKTAAMYTDLSLMTYNQAIGADASKFFQNMAIGNLEGQYTHLLVAPISLKPSILRLMDEQISLGKQGYIFLKMNSITDADIMKKLSEASCVGVEIVLVIRGICCILPQIPDKTDSIHIYNVVGRFLEHTRLYAFGRGSAQKLYLASADFMTRNTERRVEIACPIYDEAVRTRVGHIMEANLYDNVKARTMDAQGIYHPKLDNKEAVNCQDMLLQESEMQAQMTPLPLKTKNFFQRIFSKHILVG